VVVILLVVSDVAFPSIYVPGISTATPSKLSFWKNTEVANVLHVTYADVENRISPGKYTAMLDLVFRNTRTTGSDGPHRHILHRGSGEVEASKQLPGLTGESASVPTDVQLYMMPNGLPTRMNPGIFADPVKNDLLIFIDTEKDNTAYRESIRVPDIPLDVPFTLAVVVDRKMVEVYVNCQLEVTKLLEGVPRDVEKDWYGLAGSAPLNGQIQNLRLWNETLTPTQMKSECGRTITFPAPKAGACLR
jgi:hypothetical protein